MIKAAVIGATGYAGVDLVRILSGHPNASILSVSSQSYKGQLLSDVYPHLGVHGDMTLDEGTVESVIGADVIFLALPHGLAVSLVPALLQTGAVVIDLGADFRIRDASSYSQWYYAEHTAASLLKKAVYGLTELHRDAVEGADLIANPGCYPTASTLALAPLLKEGLAADEPIIIDAKSGVSGAGRSPSLKVHFCEVNDNLRIYSPAGTHRHTPEIEQELSVLAGREVTVSFNPHLVPMNRGILCTCYVRPSVPVTQDALVNLYRDFYRGEPFVRILGDGRMPETRFVTGSNGCCIGVAVDNRAGRIVVVSAIDNLIKGAAGQAVQNMNVRFGLDEKDGLNSPGLYP